MEIQEIPEIERNYIERNEKDKKRINKNNDNIKNEVICSLCKENCFININVYKINLFCCKNGHNINNILFENYENTQVSTHKKLCENYKTNKNDKKFYKCLFCKIFIMFNAHIF